MWAAATSLAYNIGPSAYAGSTVARRFSANRWQSACDNFLSWNKGRVAGALRPIKGLTRRREAERLLCMKDVRAANDNTPAALPGRGWPSVTPPMAAHP